MPKQAETAMVMVTATRVSDGIAMSSRRGRERDKIKKVIDYLIHQEMRHAAAALEVNENVQ